MPSLYDLMKSAEKAKKAKKAAERPVDDGAAANAAATAAVNRKYGSFVLCVSGERGRGGRGGKPPLRLSLPSVSVHHNV